MKLGQTLHGFTVVRVQQLNELKATLYEFSYDKNGARLLWLDRDDSNMTFSIAFKTPPKDDTGVFHIIEHSVLCGSEKYPVKDPFVLLLKSSLQTFLNALTFSDKTAYPVCSRNRQDFLNLIDVYLDAVLHPLSAVNPHAFLQEGWHYELTDDGELTRNGVVYNEMKGSFSNPDTVLFAALERSLFPDTCYGFVSGGDPEHIPELTYADYLDNYHRCYHPSNSFLFLDGNIDTDAVLSKLDSFLCAFDAAVTNTEIPMQQPVCPPQAVSYYEITPEDAKFDRVLLSGGYVYGTYDDIEEQYACEILAEVLSGTNDAPLSKALLEQGLCEEVEIDNTCDLQQPFVSITLRNTSEQKAALCWQTVTEVLKKLAAEGLDRTQLHAALDHLEFVQREKDSGRSPKGLIFGIYAMEEWLYGGDPVRKLELAETFAKLRKKVEQGWFEALLERIFLNNPHQAKVMLLPDATLGQKKQAQDKLQLAELKKCWSEQQLQDVQAAFQALRKTQETPDSPAQLASLPKLSLKDIPEQMICSEALQTELLGHRVLHTQINTGGISYLTLYFSLRDLPLEMISKAEFLCTLISELATEQFSPTQLNTVLQANLGHFTTRIGAYAPNGTDTCDPYFEISIAVLEEKKQIAVSLLQEILLHSRFDDTKYIFQLLRQAAIAAEQNMVSSGHVIALQHALSALSASSAVGNAVEGIGMLRWLQKTKTRFENDPQTVCAELAALCRTIFVRDRLSFAVTGALDASWLTCFMQAFPEGALGQDAMIHPRPCAATGFQIPAQIGFAAKALHLEQPTGGTAKVASKILSLDYLWEQVRVKGGAYGTGFSVRQNGLCFFTSYRDPDPCGALAVFSRSGDALRAFCENDSTVVDDAVISCITDLQPLLSPRAEGQQNASNFLNGVSRQLLQQQFSEVLHTTKADLYAFSRLLDDAQSQGVICVVGSESSLDRCGGLLQQRELVQGAPAVV